MPARPSPLDAARALLAAHPRVVLAVSGGGDSMTLLHAVALARAARGGAPAGTHVVVATFDHGTGEHAVAARALVEVAAAERGLEVRVGRRAMPGAGEAAWREARWRFLRAVARAERATVVTAHTRDDQVETVAFRILRGSGARGMAGLYAASDVARPFIDLSRRHVLAFARAHAVRWLEDPSNASRAHARNRLRHEILPALRLASPGIDAELLALARRAARWRAELEALAARLVPDRREGRSLVIARAALAGLDAEALALLWPALAARAGVALDRRGTLRLAEFTMKGGVGGRIPLAGGREVRMREDALVFLARAGRRPRAPRAAVPLVGARVAFGAWWFRRRPVDIAGEERSSPAIAELPADARLEVRAWRPGDRMRLEHPPWARRVKRYLSEARVAVQERPDWPVVLADGEIVWIPGVRRSDAATARSGRPVVLYTCERYDR